MIKKRGDAIQLLTCYAGKKVTFDEFKKEFMARYPSVTITDFKLASQSILAAYLSTENMLCGMAKLEYMSQTIVEAYLRNKALTKAEFNDKTELKLL